MKGPTGAKRRPAPLLVAMLVLGVIGCAHLYGQPLPNRLLVGYWHNWGGSPTGFPITAVPQEYDVIDVAFATPTVPFGATMTFTPDPGIYPVASAFAADVQALQAAGKKVLISIGGANDPVHLDTAADVQAFITSMLQIINTYGFDGLDIDLEGGSLTLLPGDTDFANPTSPRIVNLIAAVSQLVAQLPSGFWLTAAPETALVQGGYSAYAGVWGAYLPVIHALRSVLTFVHVQHYNTGSMFGRDGQLYSPATADFHVAMADMLISGFPVVGGAVFPPLSQDQVLIGLPASPQAAGSGFTQATVVHAALDHLLLGQPSGGSYVLADPNGYLGFRGLMTWSVNWDVNAGSAFSSAHRDYLDHVHLRADASVVSAAAGGTVGFTLRAGRGHAGRPYYLVPSATGTNPGTPLPGGLVLPVNLDIWSTFAFSPAGAQFFQGFTGTLDGDGEAFTQLLVPGSVITPGWTMDFAGVVVNPFDFVSPPIAITVGP